MSLLTSAAQVATAVNTVGTALGAFAAIKPKRGFQPAGNGGTPNAKLDNQSILYIVPTVTIEEQHNDELAVTEHPVEAGAAITDHAYKRPALLTIRVGWSQGDGPSTAYPQGGADPNYLPRVYQALEILQAKAVLLTVYTGKRVYQNMVIQSLGVITDERSEHALFARITFRQLLIVSTVVATIPPDPTVLAQPQSALPTVNTGVKQLGPAPNYNSAAASP